MACLSVSSPSSAKVAAEDDLCFFNDGRLDLRNPKINTVSYEVKVDFVNIVDNYYQKLKLVL